MPRRLVLFLLLMLTALQAVGPLLHAHREAEVFGGGIHLPGLAAFTAGENASSADAKVMRASAMSANSGAVVTAALGLDDRPLPIPDLGLAPLPRVPTPPVRTERRSAGVELSPALRPARAQRPWPQGPPAA